MPLKAAAAQGREEACAEVVEVMHEVSENYPRRHEEDGGRSQVWHGVERR